MPKDPSQRTPRGRRAVPLDVSQPIWTSFFAVAPLVVIGTREADGSYDLAPKHMAGPCSWDNYFGFVCSPNHSTYGNARREGAFTVSYPRPDQVVLAGLAASPRCVDGTKPTVEALPTVAAERFDAPCLRDAYLRLECELHRIIDGFGDNSLITGRVIAGRVHPDALRRKDRDDQDVVGSLPLLAYLHPGRFAKIRKSWSLPLPAGFRR